MLIERPNSVTIILVLLMGATGVAAILFDPVYPAAVGLVLAIITLAFLVHQRIRSELSVSTNILKTQLLNLLEKPDSKESLISLIEEVQCHIGSEQSVFVKCEADQTGLVILANTGSRSSWSDFLFDRTLKPGFETFLDSRNGNRVWSITINDLKTGTNFSFLAKPRINRNIKNRELKFLSACIDLLSEVYIATSRARLSQRHALYAERAAISRELHDSLAQSLSYLKIQTTRIQSMLNARDALFSRNEINEVVEEVRDNLNLAYRHLRELMTTFRLTMEGRDLAHALEESIDEFAHRSSIAFELDNRLMGDELSVDQEMQVLHISRETLSNMVRHSHAQRGRIILQRLGDDLIQLSAIDDGVGIDTDQQRSRYHGLLIMQERVHRLNGHMWVHESPDGGTRIDVRFPATLDSQSNEPYAKLAV
ncbi:MAG: histidine kinase [Gammaproteobacteria bacterium]|nr:histidine kinase [Gammaproteobacteria bacterium]